MTSTQAARFDSKRRGGKRRDGIGVRVSRLTRWMPLAAVVVLLGAAMLAAVFGNPSIPLVDPPGRQTDPEDAPTQDRALPTGTARPLTSGGQWLVLPEWVATALSALCAATLLLIVVTMGWLLLRDNLAQRRAAPRRDASATPAVVAAARQLRDAVEAGLSDLDDSGGDPRRAVIACWVRLEAAAAAAGTAREVGDTSTDLVTRLLAAHLVSADVLGAFAAVYREARFATHPVDETMRGQARAALRQVRDELAGARPPGGGRAGAPQPGAPQPGAGR